MGELSHHPPGRCPGFRAYRIPDARLLDCINCTDPRSHGYDGRDNGSSMRADNQGG
jgi:hypothetical protein